MTAQPTGLPTTAENRSTGYLEGGNRGSGEHTAGCCGARFGGLKTAHCSGCHQTFTAITAFDKHRTGSHPDSTRHCVDPATVGLVDAGRAYPCWGSPGTDEDGGPTYGDRAI